MGTFRRPGPRAIAAAVVGAGLLTVAVLAVGAHDAGIPPPPDVMSGEVRCTIPHPIAPAGAPGDDAGQQLARRMRRFCDAMNGTPTPGPAPGLVNAREFCLDMQRRGQLLPGDDCKRVPTDQTYHR